MIDENKNNNTFIKIIFFIFISFVIMYFSKGTLYFEHQNYIKKELTNEAINRFENDVKNGNNVTLNDYKVNNEVDYSNILSKTGTKINSIVETFMNEGIKKTLKVLSQLFYE